MIDFSSIIIADEKLQWMTHRVWQPMIEKEKNKIMSMRVHYEKKAILV